MDPNMVAAGTTVPSPMSPQMQTTPQNSHALGVMAGTGNVLQPLQLIAAMQGLKTMGPKAAPKHPRVKAPSPLSMAKHCKRGHVRTSLA